MNPESVNAWTNIIANYGFPIAMTVAMGIYIYITQKQHREDIRIMKQEQTAELKDIRQEHKEEIKELKKAVDKLSELVGEFVTLVREGEKK